MYEKRNITVKKSKKRIIPIIIAVVIILLIAADWIFSVWIYNDNFNSRFDSYEPLMLYLDDFEGLSRTKYEFPSDKGQMLTGYLYTADDTDECKGIIVIAHGFGGGGHNSYMDCANRFAHSGYDVFAYDATACDESEGKGVGGLPQGVIDLDHAISFVEENFPGKPVALFGHSWGGYSACGVLTYHPEVKAVIECSGFNSSSDMIEAEGKIQAGDGIYLMLPFVHLHEYIKYGKVAANTAMDGFAATDAAVMVVHSSDDTIVPVRYGYDLYYEKYGSDPRFTFIRLEDKGHNYVYNDHTYINEFNADFEKWRDSLDYDFTAAENKERFSSEKVDYMRNNLDREKWSNMLDDELFDKFVAFYDAHIND